MINPMYDLFFLLARNAPKKLETKLGISLFKKGNRIDLRRWEVPKPMEVKVHFADLGLFQSQKSTLKAILEGNST